MGRTLLLDAKPLSNLLARIAIGRVLDSDQSYYRVTYNRLAALVDEEAVRLVSTPAVATEALHFLLNKSDEPPKIEALRRSPISLRAGSESDLRDYGDANLKGVDFADYTLLRAWDSLANSGTRPFPITITTDWPLKRIATGRFAQNAYTVEELEGQPDLL